MFLASCPRRRSVPVAAERLSLAPPPWSYRPLLPRPQYQRGRPPVEPPVFPPPGWTYPGTENIQNVRVRLDPLPDHFTKDKGKAIGVSDDQVRSYAAGIEASQEAMEEQMLATIATSCYRLAPEQPIDGKSVPLEGFEPPPRPE